MNGSHLPSGLDRANPANRTLRILRAGALLSVVAGALGAVSLLYRAGQHTPRFLLSVMEVWVLLPFVALAFSNLVSLRWPNFTRATLYIVTFVFVLSSLAIYGNMIAIAPPGSPRGFVFVVVPPAAFLSMTIIVSIAAWISRRKSR